MEHDTGSLGLPDTSQTTSSTPKPSLRQRIIPQARGVFNRILSADRAIHAQIASRFPKTLAAFDILFGGIFQLLCHPAFALILALGLGVLTVAGIVDNYIYVSVAIMWLATTLWIARSEFIKRLSVLSRMLVVGLLAVSIGLVCRSFGNYALRKYEEQQAKQKQQQEIGLSKEGSKTIDPQQNIPISTTPTPHPTPAPSPSPPVTKPRSRQSKASQRKKTPCTWADTLLGKC